MDDMTRRLLAALALCLVCASAFAQSLGDVARRREEERKKKEKAAAAAPRYDDASLGATGTGKGTYNVGTTGASRSSTGRVESAGEGGSVTRASAERLTETDVRRRQAREELEALYGRIVEGASELWEQAGEYRSSCRNATPATPEFAARCDGLLSSIGRLAFQVGAAMDDAEENARKGLLPPGDIREIRQRYNMDGEVWDELQALVRQYR